MNLIDLHCDTALGLFEKNEPLSENSLHISQKLFSGYEKYVQLAAVFTPSKLSDDDGYRQFWKVRENLITECKKTGIPIVASSSELRRAISEVGRAFILTLEDARILSGKISRVRELYDAGVRVITPLWGGETVMGGSHDTQLGLTDFGKEAMLEMTHIGIIPDISHASFKSADEIMDICEKSGVSPIATHMNSYSCCPHSRNLTDERYMRLVKLGGVVGVSLCPPHLAARPDECSAKDVLRHILHYFKLHPRRVAFGCDFDGTQLPPNFKNISSIAKISDMLRENGYAEDDISALYWDTALKFLYDNLPKE